MQTNIHSSMRALWLAVIATALASAFLVAGCCSHPWDKFKMSILPDYSCRTGADGGYDFYVWECQNNQRVVIYQWTTYASCDEPRKESAACGELTAIEMKLGKIERGCDRMIGHLRWRPTQ